jgi:hypothetical protein
MSYIGFLGYLVTMEFGCILWMFLVYLHNVFLLLVCSEFKLVITYHSAG